MNPKLTLDQIRDTLRSRLTKGDAFRFSNEEYEQIQSRVKEKLANMSLREMWEQFPKFMY